MSEHKKELKEALLEARERVRKQREAEERQQEEEEFKKIHFIKKGSPEETALKKAIEWWENATFEEKCAMMLLVAMEKEGEK